MLIEELLYIRPGPSHQRARGSGKMPLRISKPRTDKVSMEQESINADHISILAGRSSAIPGPGVLICGSAIVKITAEWRQVSFCTCRPIEYRVRRELPRPYLLLSRGRFTQRSLIPSEMEMHMARWQWALLTACCSGHAGVGIGPGEKSPHASLTRSGLPFRPRR